MLTRFVAILLTAACRYCAPCCRAVAFCRAVALSALAVMSAGYASVALAAEKPLTTVADLRYGVVLYEFFQENHFEALSELMVAKERGGIQGHKDNPELIEGSLNLAYGMDGQAGETFTRLLDETKPRDVRNAAWFYLSKIRYQRGEYDKVKDSLANIEKPSNDLVDEMEAMAIQLLLREQKFDEAAARLNKASDRVKAGNQFQYWRPYLNFNIGAILARLERMDEAQTFFAKVAKERLSVNTDFHDEQFALYDKAFTAAGYGHFQDENYQQAIDAFGNVRQEAPLVNDALLGYGWAKARLGNYQAALVPWSILSQRPLADDAVQESLLAIPYAYLQLGDTLKAIESYSNAEQVFTRELALIDEVGAGIVSQSIEELLDLDNDGTSYSWLVPEDNTLVTSPSRYLFSLYSYNRFQNSVQTLVDLHRVRRRLEDWQRSLDAYADLMDYRLKTFRLQQQPEGYRDLTEELVDLQQQRDAMTRLLAEAKRQQNVFLLLDEDRRDQLELVESGEGNLALLSANGDNVDEEAQWIQRYRGILLWSATMDFDDRLWSVESQLNEINAALVSADRADSTIQRLLTEAPDITSAQQRIASFVTRVDQLLISNNQVMAGIEEELRTQMFAALALQRQRVQFYLAEARLAVAQLYDNVYLERSK